MGRYNSDYVHFIAPAKLDPEFKSKIKYITLDSMDKLKGALLVLQNYVSWDLETSSLNPEEGFIVGIAFAYNTDTGYYIPINHVMEPDRSLGKEACDIFYEYLLSRKMTFLYNARFDLRYMEHKGYDMSKVKFFDVMDSVWLADTNFKMPSLKWAELHFLGWEADTFSEALGDSQTFEYVDIDVATKYAGQDAVGTMGLANVTMKYYIESGTAGKLDQQVLYPMMKWEDTIIPIDKKRVDELRLNVYTRLKEVEHEIYTIAGTTFKIGSGRELTYVFEKLGLDTGSRVKSGDMKLDIKAIQKVDRETGHPICKALVEYKQLFKFLNSYVDVIDDIASSPQGGGRFNYMLCAAPTGRTASGKDGKNSYFSKLNIQSLPKAHAANWYVREATEQEKIENKDILGYMFSQEEKSNKTIEGFTPYLNIRRAFVPKEGSVWVSIDMAGEELRLVANVFREPTWTQAFLNNEDVHKATALMVWGPENYNKDKRKIAKTLNFACLYGGTAYTLQSKMPEKPIDECEEILHKFHQGLSVIFNGQERMIRQARKTGVIYNAFGRPRRVRYYFQSPESKKRAFGQRTVKNNPIQSAGGDILKIMIIRLWKEIFSKPEYSEVKFCATIHDEINFSVPRSQLMEVLPILIKCMTVKVPGWEIPMVCGLTVGYDWGTAWEFDYDIEKGIYTPKWEDVKEDKPKEVEAEEVVDSSIYWEEDEEEESF